MKIIGIKVYLSTTTGRWVDEDIECERKDVEAIRKALRDQYEAMGLTVEDIRLRYAEK